MKNPTISLLQYLKCALCFLVLASSISAQQNFLEKKVTDVDINFLGAKNVSESRIRNFMSVKPGTVFSYEALDKDVKRLYESGLVDDVRFLAEEEGAGVKIIAEVETRPSLSGIKFNGNSIYSDRRLASKIEMASGGALSDSEILKAKRSIETFYKENGYPDTSVSYEINSSEADGFSEIEFVIDEGIRGEVDEIIFEGNKAFSSVALRREMQTKEKGIFSFITKSGKLDAPVLEEDLEKLTSFYRNNGYLRASIPGVQRKPKKNGKVDLIIPINEGAKYTVNSISFQGMTVFTTEEIWPALSMVNKNTYSAKKMQGDITRVRAYYGAKGYADAAVRPDIQNATPTSVNITYKVTEGKRFRVGKVNIQGNNTTKDRVIRREIPLNPGDWFNSVDLDVTKNRLSNLNYFSNVQSNSSKSVRDGYRDVDVVVNEKRTGSLGFGAGFSSIDNIVGNINLEQTNFDLFDPGNGFQGGGQRFNAQIRAGAERQDASISLTEPWFLGRKLALGGEIYYQDRQFISSEFDQINWGGAIFLRKPLGSRAFIKAEYRLETVEIEADQDSSQFFQDQEGDFLRHAATLSYVYDSRNSNIMPRKGHRINASATFTAGDVETYTLNFSGEKHIQLPYDLILNFAGDFTTVDSYSDAPVPIFERTFLGGARDLRGFEFRDVGSVADNTRDAQSTETIGGQTSAFLSTEVTFPLFSTIRGAAFLESGFVNEDAYDFSPSTLHSNYGFGLRLNLPFGPFAIDYAIPFQSGDQQDDGGQFQFYLDYAF